MDLRGTLTLMPLALPHFMEWVRTKVSQVILLVLATILAIPIVIFLALAVFLELSDYFGSSVAALSTAGIFTLVALTLLFFSRQLGKWQQDRAEANRAQQIEMASQNNMGSLLTLAITIARILSDNKSKK